VDRNAHFETYKLDIPSTEGMIIAARTLNWLQTRLGQDYSCFSFVLIFSCKVEIDSGKMKRHNPEKDYLQFIENFTLMAKATPNL
jgi:hypothetical protein